MKQIIVCLSILVVFMFPFSTVVKAESNVDYNALSEYDGFAKAVFDSYVTGTTYVAGKYTNNLHYVNETIGQVKQNASSLWEGFKNEDCGEGCNWGWEFIKQLLAGGATAIDVIKDFFDSEEQLSIADIEVDFYSQYFTVSGATITPKSGYTVDVSDSNVVLTGVTSIVDTANTIQGTSFFKVYHPAQNGSQTTDTNLGARPYSELPAFGNVSVIISRMYQAGITLIIKKSGVPEVPSLQDKPIVQINNYIQNSPPLIHPDFKPVITAQLVCPSGSSGLDVVGSAIKMNEFTLQVDKTTSQTNFNGENCVVEFVPVLPTVTDDGLIVVDGVDIETNLPVSTAGNFDYSLVEYVANSYNYATTVISNGVNGLRSIIAGTTGLVTFAGSLFGFLPPEILTLFIGGFSVALGLWVFKK